MLALVIYPPVRRRSTNSNRIESELSNSAGPHERNFRTAGERERKPQDEETAGAAVSVTDRALSPLPSREARDAVDRESCSYARPSQRTRLEQRYQPYRSTPRRC